MLPRLEQLSTHSWLLDGESNSIFLSFHSCVCVCVNHTFVPGLSVFSSLLQLCWKMPWSLGNVRGRRHSSGLIGQFRSSPHISRAQVRKQIEGQILSKDRFSDFKKRQITFLILKFSNSNELEWVLVNQSHSLFSYICEYNYELNVTCEILSYYSNEVSLSKLNIILRYRLVVMTIKLWHGIAKQIILFGKWKGADTHTHTHR